MRVAAGLLSMGLAYASAAAPSGVPALSVGWQNCLAGDPTTLFTLAFLHDGSVTYTGQEYVREKGTRVFRIDTRHFERLVETATKAVSPDAPKAETSPYKQRPPFCMNVKVDDGNSAVESIVSPLDPPGKKLHRQMLRYLDLQPWVCPTRGWAPGEMVGCPPAFISFSYTERENCYSSGHGVSLWTDGQVHYFAGGVAGSDRYYRIDRSTVARLFEIGWRLEGGPIIAGLQHDHKRRYFMNASALIAFKQALTEFANVPWQSLPVRGGCEDKNLEFPQGYLELRR